MVQSVDHSAHRMYDGDTGIDCKGLADGLSANPDNLHFSASALQEFGYRYFDAFRSLPCYADTFVTDEKIQNQERSAIEQL